MRPLYIRTKYKIDMTYDGIKCQCVPAPVCTVGSVSPLLASITMLVYEHGWKCHYWKKSWWFTQCTQIYH